MFAKNKTTFVCNHAVIENCEHWFHDSVMGFNHWSVAPVSVEVGMLRWQETYAAAILETDNKKLEQGLAKTEGLIFLRMQDLTVQDCE
jgi:hypothetical protein